MPCVSVGSRSLPQAMVRLHLHLAINFMPAKSISQLYSNDLTASLAYVTFIYTIVSQWIWSDIKMEKRKTWNEELLNAINPTTSIVGFHKAKPGWFRQFKDIIQKDFDIWYVDGGSGRILINGVWHSFERGDLLIIPPGASYQGECAAPDTAFCVYFAHILPFGSLESHLNDELACSLPLKISRMDQTELPEIFQRFFKAFVLSSPQYSLAVRGLALQLFQTIFEELDAASQNPFHMKPHRIASQAKALIENRLTERLTLAKMASKCTTSRSRLSLLFMQSYGIPPIEYLLRMRIRKAKLLLAKGERIKDVAEKTGFHSQHYFCRLFKKREGIAPTQYALLHMDGNVS